MKANRLVSILRINLGQQPDRFHKRSVEPHYRHKIDLVFGASDIPLPATVVLELCSKLIGEKRCHDLRLAFGLAFFVICFFCPNPIFLASFERFSA